ncbi:hypothetical protein CDO81_04630 [Roseateles puraquae]|uniref:Uncharacterized protein n=1 Tax=Roseateles puraquae TaxID=431059 RepID=A0A254NCQ5_9BURK|nr:hypothetical protein CDO81_04630 [Roseateles puraquae]
MHVHDSRRPVIQLNAAPDLRGGWSLELQAVFLDGRKVTRKGIGTGTTAAGIVAGLLELLQEAHDAGTRGLPTASCTLWTVATSEAEADQSR